MMVLDRFLNSDAGRPLLVGAASPGQPPREQTFWLLYNVYRNLLKGCQWGMWLDWHCCLYEFMQEGYSLRLRADGQGMDQFTIMSFTNYFDAFESLLAGTSLQFATRVRYQSRCRRPECGVVKTLEHDTLHSPLGNSKFTEQDHADFAVGRAIQTGPDGTIAGFLCPDCGHKSRIGDGVLDLAPPLLTLAFRGVSVYAVGGVYELTAQDKLHVTNQRVTLVVKAGLVVYAPLAFVYFPNQRHYACDIAQPAVAVDGSVVRVYGHYDPFHDNFCRGGQDCTFTDHYRTMPKMKHDHFVYGDKVTHKRSTSRSHQIEIVCVCVRGVWCAVRERERDFKSVLIVFNAKTLGQCHAV